jgi:DNA-binding NarL/FixJ family response regulator
VSSDFDVALQSSATPNDLPGLQHRLDRKGIRDLLSDEDDIAVVGEARNGYEAVDLATALQPDAVVMDIAMPDPVCGMAVEPDALGAEYAGQLYRFCSPACRDLFLTQPKQYTPSM